MQIAAMLIGLGLLALGVLILSLFIPAVGGGSLFGLWWPGLVGTVVLLCGAALAVAGHARRNPAARVYTSRWPRIAMALVVVVIAVAVAGGMLV